MTVLGKVSLKGLLYDELSEFVLASSVLLDANMDNTEVPSDPRFQIAQRMDAFVKRFAQVTSCRFFRVVRISDHYIALCRHFSKCVPEPLSHSSDTLPYNY